MPAEWVILYALLAAEPGAADTTPPDPTPALEMLEFLGHWETTKGESVDPAQFSDAAFNDSPSVRGKPSEDNKHDNHE